MNKGLLIAIGAVIIAGGAYSFVMAEKKAAMKAEEMEAKAMMEKEVMEKAAMEEAATASPEDAAMMKKDGEMMDGEMMKDDMNKEEMDDAAMMKKDEMTDEMKKAGAYLPYEASKVAMASEGDVVLFFRASWCPSCRALDSDIKANLGAIPAEVTILDVDYDAQTALKQKYGVTTQHTLVQVAADGTLIKKWSGGSTLASVVGQVE